MTSASGFLTVNHRGKNWIEDDSVKLIDAYQFVMSSKEGTIRIL